MPYTNFRGYRRFKSLYGLNWVDRMRIMNERRKKIIRKNTSKASYGRRPAKAAKAAYVRKALKPRYNLRKKKYDGYNMTLREKFGCDVNSNTVPEGYEDGGDFWSKFWASTIEAAPADPVLVPANAATTTNLAYARFKIPLSQVLTSNNMASQFSKVKVNRVTIIFTFPDQLAQSSNSEYSTLFHINYSDMYKVDIDGFGEDTAWTSGQQLLNRPGWKTTNVKKTNKFVITFRPTAAKTREFSSSTAGTEVDQKKLIPSGWFDIDGDGTSSVCLYGPTLAIHFPHKVDVTGGGSDFGSMFTGASQCDYLTYSNVAMYVNCSFKGLDNDAVQLSLA